MVAEVDMQNKEIEKASRWITYLLVDLRVVFIVMYVYVTAVNLISTTANVEATGDMNTYNVTSLPEHTNVFIFFTFWIITKWKQELCLNDL